MFAPFAVRIGKELFPGTIWTDFAGLQLFQWYSAVWEMGENNKRCGRLPFMYGYEMWLRRTPTRWWKLSCVTRIKEGTRDVSIKDATIGHEALVLPEQVEAALLTCSRRLLAGAKRVGRWTDDCEALSNLLDDPAGYLSALEAGEIPLPRFMAPDFRILV
jgi:hypothetical protein